MASRNYRSWEESYADLVAFHKKYGHCNVPQRDRKFGSLGLWVSNQRLAKKPNGARRALSQYQIDRLNEIDFVWKLDRFEQQWNDKFERLKRYKIVHGDCLVPQHFKEDPGLGHWVGNQRMNHKRKTIRPDRQAKLERLGFSWVKDKRYCWSDQRDTKNLDSHWEDMYQSLVEWKEENGHCMVPNFSKGKYEVLGRWVRQQRTRYLEGWLPDDRKTRLEDLGFVWKIDPSDAESSICQRQWDKMFTKLVAFKETHGHAEVPQKYKEDPKLGHWVGTQRSSRFNMDLKRVEKLNSVGFTWKPPKGPSAKRKPHKEDDTNEVKGDSNKDRQLEDVDGAELENDTLEAQDKARQLESRTGHQDDQMMKKDTDDILAQDFSGVGVEPLKFSVGTKVEKFFKGHGWFMGEVVSHDGDYYEVLYEDEDSEEYEEEELAKLVQSSDMAKVQVGSRVRIYCPEESRFYAGTVVKERRRKKKRFFVRFDDGDEEWVNLYRWRFLLLPDPCTGNDSDDVKAEVKSRRELESQTSINGAMDACNSVDGVKPDSEVKRATPTTKMTLGEESSEVAVGSRLAISDDDGFRYVATVSQKKEQRVFVHYCDGDAKWIDLRRCKHRLLAGSKRQRVQGDNNNAAGVIREASVKLPDSRDNTVGNRSELDTSSKVEIGARIAVYWPDDNKYYEGTVTRERSNKKGRFFVQYDDGDCEWIDPGQDKFRLLPTSKQRRVQDDGNDEILSKVRIGSRISVYWSFYDKFYDGRIVQERPSKKKRFFVRYDDGDGQWINLRTHKFRLLSESNPRSIQSMQKDANVVELY